MAKRKLPSDAQARLIAQVWSTNGTVRIRAHGYELPTRQACVREGWLKPTAVTGTYPNGGKYVEHFVSDFGLDALEDYLRESRFKRS